MKDERCQRHFVANKSAVLTDFVGAKELADAFAEDAEGPVNGGGTEGCW